MRIVALLCLLLVSTAAAQERPLPLPQPELVPQYTVLKLYLNLSGEQLESLIQIATRRNEAQRDLWRQITEKQSAIDTALQSGSADPRTIGQLMIEIHALRQTSISNAPYREAALNVLAADQKTRLAPLVQALQLLNTAFEAVSLNLIDSPPARPIMIQPAGSAGSDPPPPSDPHE